MITRLAFWFSALSLLLLIAAVVLWVRSYTGCDGVFLNNITGAGTDLQWESMNFSTLPGMLRIEYSRAPSDSSMRPPPELINAGWSTLLRRVTYQESPNYPRNLGFGYTRTALIFHAINVQGSGINMRGIVMPLWFVAMVLAIAPAIWTVRFIVRRRTQCASCCPKCGYDMRATPDKCPECGNVPAAAINPPSAPLAASPDRA